MCLQGFVAFKKGKTMVQVKGLIFKQEALKHGHVGDDRGLPARGSPEANRNYCKKPESAVPDTFWEVGVLPAPSGQGKRNDIAGAVHTLKTEGMRAVLDKHPEEFMKYLNGMRAAKLMFDDDEANSKEELPPVNVIVHTGPPGAGKSRCVRALLVAQRKRAYWMPFRAHHRADVWFDGYVGQEVLVLDNFEGEGHIPSAIFMRMMERYPIQVPVKGGFVMPRWREVHITSSLPISHWYATHEPTALTRRITAINEYAAPPAEKVSLPVPVKTSMEEMLKKIAGDKEEMELITMATSALDLTALAQSTHSPIQHPPSSVPASAAAPRSPGPWSPPVCARCTMTSSCPEHSGAMLN